MMHSRIRRTLAYLVGAACLAWVLHDVHFDDLLRQVRSLHVGWLVAALAIDVLSTVIHGFRWQFLLKPFTRLSVVRSTQAIYAGLFASQILPLRAGEFVRGYLVSRWTELPFSSVLPSMLTERVFDGFVLVLGLILAAFFVPLPTKVQSVGWAVGLLMLIVTAVVLWMAWIDRPPPAALPPDSRRQKRLAHRIALLFSDMSQGLRVVWTSRQSLPAFFATLVFLALQMISFGLIMKTYGLHLSIFAPAVVLIIVRLGTAIPSTPANIGPYQFFCVLGLTLFGVEKTMATGFAIVASIVLAVPLLVLGMGAFVSGGLTLSEVRRSGSQGG